MPPHSLETSWRDQRKETVIRGSSSILPRVRHVTCAVSSLLGCVARRGQTEICCVLSQAAANRNACISYSRMAPNFSDPRNCQPRLGLENSSGADPKWNTLHCWFLMHVCVYCAMSVTSHVEWFGRRRRFQGCATPLLDSDGSLLLPYMSQMAGSLLRLLGSAIEE